MALNVISAELGGKATGLRARRMEDGKGRNNDEGDEEGQERAREKGKEGQGLVGIAGCLQPQMFR